MPWNGQAKPGYGAKAEKLNLILFVLAFAACVFYPLIILFMGRILNDNLNRTNLDAFAAVNTLIVIYNRAVIDYMNRISGASFLALPARDTPNLAKCSSYCSPIMILALDKDFALEWHHLYHIFRANAYARFATNALGMRYLRQAFLHSDSAKTADAHTITKT